MCDNLWNLSFNIESLSSLYESCCLMRPVFDIMKHVKIVTLVKSVLHGKKHFEALLTVYLYFFQQSIQTHLWCRISTGMLFSQQLPLAVKLRSSKRDWFSSNLMFQQPFVSKRRGSKVIKRSWRHRYDNKLHPDNKIRKVSSFLVNYLAFLLYLYVINWCKFVNN